DQRVIVQDAYVQTQKILTIIGICTMFLAGVAMLGLAPYNLSADVNKDQSEDQEGDGASGSTTKPKITSLVTKYFKK
ncbi:hypothetical protein IWW41_003960, partial [Coemansia sp. RSA 2522]